MPLHHGVNHHINDTRKKRTLKAKCFPYISSAPNNTSENITPPAIARANTISNEKRNRPTMISNCVVRRVMLSIVVLIFAGQLQEPLDYWLKQVGLIVRFDTLEHGS